MGPLEEQKTLPTTKPLSASPIQLYLHLFEDGHLFAYFLCIKTVHRACPVVVGYNLRAVHSKHEHDAYANHLFHSSTLDTYGRMLNYLLPC